MTFGSLFAGIGGLDLGLERAGMKCKWQLEIDDYARRVIAKHWPNVRRWDDVITFPPDAIRDDVNEVDVEVGVSGFRQESGIAGTDWQVDLICGGFPCQDISYAGKGTGLSGERSGLFFEAIRVIRVLAPRYILLENVAALISGATEYRTFPERCLCGWPDRWRRLYLCEQVQQQIRLHICRAGGSWHGRQGDESFAMACERIWRHDSTQQERLRQVDGGSRLGAIWKEGGSIFGENIAPPEAKARASEIGHLRPAFGESWMDGRESKAWCSALGINEGIEPERSRSIIGKLLTCPTCGRWMGNGTDDFVRQRWMGTVLGTLASLGYCLEWHCLQAADFGAPHIRDRVFIIGWSGVDAGARPIVRTKPTGASWRHTQSPVCRRDHGIPNRVDRLRCLGNAVVPQVAEYLGKEIMRHAEAAERTGVEFVHSRPADQGGGE